MRFLLTIFLFLFSFSCLAETTEVPDLVKKITDILGPFLSGLIIKFPKLSMLVIIMGFLRLVFKPLIDILWGIVNLTKTKKDDEFMKKLTEHKAFVIVAYVVDWGSSISVKNPKK